MSVKITSEVFSDGNPITRKYTGDGEDISPPLHWSAVPADARELALIVDDPDAPRAEPFVHWVIYKIPADESGLPEAITPDANPKLPAGAPQGKKSFRKTGYGGPPAPGRHRHAPHHI